MSTGPRKRPGVSQWLARTHHEDGGKLSILWTSSVLVSSEKFRASRFRKGCVSHRRLAKKHLFVCQSLPRSLFVSGPGGNQLLEKTSGWRKRGRGVCLPGERIHHSGLVWLTEHYLEGSS